MKGFKHTGKGPTSGHAFPSHFGFSGSTGKSMSVGPYTRKTPAMKKGGKVRHYDDGGPVADPNTLNGAQDVEMVPAVQKDGSVRMVPRFNRATPGVSGALKDLIASIAGKAGQPGIRENMAQSDIGSYKKGGKMRRMGYAKGGDVDGNAVTLRKEPVTEFDKEYGGKGPLRPGFKRGGLKRALGGPVAMKGGGKWVKGAIKHPGALHQVTHTPKGQKIPHSKIVKAEHSRNPRVAKEARLAETLGKMHKAKGGSITKTEAKHIAEKTIGEHVRYPAPKGHKGFEKLPLFGGHHR